MRFVADELLVGYETGVELPALVEAIVALGARVAGGIEAVRVLRVVLPAGEDPRELRADYAALEGARYAELHGVGERGGGTPSDTWFTSQWHLANTGQGGGVPGADVQALDAWALTTGDPAVVLAVLDTGADFQHPECAGRLYPGWDFVNEDADASADHPHGVLVIGLAAARTNNSFGVAGVDRQCSVLPIKVLDALGFGTVIDLVQGILYAAQEGAEVISMSLVNYPGTTALREALLVARDAGCVSVACAGNAGVGSADISWPGASEHSLSIGATDRRDLRAPYSGTGQRLDFVAPGEGVVTLDASYGDGTTVFSGCSAATPVAAGIVSLMKAIDPLLTLEQARELLRLGAEDQVGPAHEDAPGRDDFYGHGRVNAFRSVATLARPTPYCTPKQASAGCWPRIAFNGYPSATPGVPFEIVAHDVLSGQFGLMLYGQQQAAIPFQGGTMCVQPPHVRTSILLSGGHGPPAANCSGRLSFDFNAYLLSGQDPQLAPGKTVHVQFWYRDPHDGAGYGTGLSDALRFWIRH